MTRSPARRRVVEREERALGAPAHRPGEVQGRGLGLPPGRTKYFSGFTNVSAWSIAFSSRSASAASRSGMFSFASLPGAHASSAPSVNRSTCTRSSTASESASSFVARARPSVAFSSSTVP